MCCLVLCSMFNVRLNFDAECWILNVIGNVNVQSIQFVFPSIECLYAHLPNQTFVVFIFFFPFTIGTHTHTQTQQNYEQIDLPLSFDYFVMSFYDPVQPIFNAINFWMDTINAVHTARNEIAQLRANTKKPKTNRR